MSTDLPRGTRFIGAETGAVPGWFTGDAPTDADIATCVACGLCLPHCPTFRLTGDETASPRGRIAAMRAVAEGQAEVDATFGDFMDLCLSCRACEHVCPSHVPYGRMIEGARVQVEKIRPRHERLLRYVGLEVVLPRGWMVTAGTVLMPLVRPLMPRRVRALMPRVRLSELARRLPEVTEPLGTSRGTVAILAGCVQDRWFRQVNRATIAVLARNGWRVLVPRHECCGALSAHYGHLEAARRMARRDVPAFASADWVIVNGAGCSAHMKEWGHLLHGQVRAAEVSAKVRDFMEFLDEQGFEPPVASPFERVAHHDPCHLLHAQRIAEAPRRVLRQVPGLELAEVPDGDRCCGAAGLYNVLEPEMADELQRAKAANIAGTGAAAVLVANPGCAMQISAGLGEHDADIAVLHPAELLDRAYRANGSGGRSRPTRNRARSR